MNHHWKKLTVLWAVIGVCYFVIEGIWRIPSNGGWANIWMIPVGGLCGVSVGLVNSIPKFYKAPMVIQAFLSTMLILVIEFISGVVLNLWLGLGIWDYSDVPCNILGQVCAVYGVLWFFLAPFAIWLEDFLRHVFWQEGEYYTVKSIYKELFTLK